MDEQQILLLTIKAHTEGLEKAKQDLQRTEDAMNKARVAAGGLAKQEDELAKKVPQTGKVYLDAQKRLDAYTRAHDPLTRAQGDLLKIEKLLTTTRDGGGSVSSANMRAYSAAQERVATFTKALSGGTNAHTHSLNENTNAVKLNRNQLLELGHVAKALGDQLAAGANPLRALATESGRIGQILSSGSGGVGGTLRAIGGLALSAVTGIAGVVTGVVALGAAGAYAFVSWINEQDKLAASLDGVGRATGVTLDGLNRIAEAGGQAAGISSSAARGLAGGFASTGKIDASQIGGLVGASKKFGLATGQSTEEAGAELAKAFADPAKGADELDKKLNLLDDSTRQLIRTFDAQGQRGEAQKVLFEALSRNMETFTDRTWTLKKAWDLLGGSISDALGKVGSNIEAKFSGPSIKDRLAMPFIPKDSGWMERVGLTHTGDNIRTDSGNAIEELRFQNMLVRSRAAEAELKERSKRAGDLVRETLPDLGQRQGLENRKSELDSALGDPAVLKAMGVAAGDAQRALQLVTDNLKNFKTGLEQQKEDAALAIQATEAYTLTERAQVAADTALAQARRQQLGEIYALNAAENARNLLLAQSARELENLITSTRDSIALIGKSPYEQEKLRGQQRLEEFDRQHNPSGGAAGAAVGSGGGAAIDSAASVLGLASNSGALRKYLQDGGVGLDPSTTAWCAALVNSAIAHSGGTGSGSNLARSFLNVGTAVTDPQRGDLAVFGRGGRGSGKGHVGFFDHANDNGTIDVLGGNQSGEVNHSDFSTRNLLGYRRLSRGDGSPAGDQADAYGRGRSALSEQNAAQLSELQSGPLKTANRALAEQVAALELQKRAFGQSTEEIARAAKQQELINEFTRQGVPLTDALRASIAETASGYGALAKATEDAQKTQQATIASMDEIRSASRDFLGTFISGLAHGESATKSLHKALSQLGEKLLQMGENSLIDALLGKSGQSGGGLLGGLLGKLLGGGFGLGGGGTPLGMGGIGHNAQGTDNWRGGPSVVGEHGPEIVDMPRGARVTSNENIRAMSKRSAPSVSTSITFGPSTIVVQGNADDRTIAQMKEEMARNNREMEAKIVRKITRDSASMQGVGNFYYGRGGAG